MAKNREPEKTVASSESEEDDEASSEEGSDSEPEQTPVTKKPSSSTPATVKKAQPPSSSKPQPQPDSSSDEEESGSESESDSDRPDLNVRPLATKPMDDPPKTSAGAKNPKSKSIASDLATPARSAAGKRPAEGKETEEAAKKAKKKVETESSEKKSNDDSKKQLFQRIWSEDDEIAILKGMIEYTTKKKADPIADLNAFHDFIKKSLHIDVSRTQLQDKIRRLKKKYANNKNKEKEGKDRAFSKPHEQKAYELSAKIWGNENGKDNGSEKVVGSPKANGGAVKKTQARKANATEVEEVKSPEAVNGAATVGAVEQVPSASRLNFNGGGMEENILRIGAELFAAGKGADRVEEWNKLKLEEMEIFQRQLQLRTAQVKLVLDTLKSTDH